MNGEQFTNNKKKENMYVHNNFNITKQGKSIFLLNTAFDGKQRMKVLRGTSEVYLIGDSI